MKDLSGELNSLRALCQKLRVPELKYHQEYGSNSDNLLSVDDLTTHFFCELDEFNHDCILDLLNKHFNSPQKASINNVAFVLDRTFDVWLRKNGFPSDIEKIFTKWRFAVFGAILFEQKVFSLEGGNHKGVLECFIDLLETLACDCVGWSAVPERSKHLVLDQLTSVSNKVLSNPHTSLSKIDQASCDWLAFQAKQASKFTKVSERLVGLESQQCWNRFSYWCAQTYIDREFENKKLPESLQTFLDLYWVKAVSESLSCQDGVNVKLDAEISNLTTSAMNAFCKQGEALFKHADTLVDEFKAKLKGLAIDFDDGIFNALESSLVSLLKQEFSDSFIEYASIPTDSSISRQFSHYDVTQILANNVQEQPADNSVDYGLRVDEWYVLVGDQSESPCMKLLAYFKYAGVYLFANYLGMKTALYAKKEMADLIKSKQLKPLKKGDGFSLVLANCLKGLSRVAESQQKARIAAAEKAKEEAERLLAEKRRAEEEAAKRAEEIAHRTKELLRKREEKLKADQEARALKHIRELNIGAWVALTIESGTERYKLVVKIAASGKYIFVDKLGIKKKEYKENQLVELCLSNKLEFLSDGAEFEDSLQRVVSRLRMEK